MIFLVIWSVFCGLIFKFLKDLSIFCSTLSFSKSNNCSDVKGENGVFSAILIRGFIRFRGTGTKTLVLPKHLEI